MNETLNWEKVKSLAADGVGTPSRRVEKAESEWKGLLNEDVFQVTRLHGTERPFSSEMCGLVEPGLYGCACCQTNLFDASEKYDSGSGWPSFTEPVEENVINYKHDSKMGMNRIEVLCNVCDAHLGHVFPDGPQPTGLRYCINSISLEKVSG